MEQVWGLLVVAIISLPGGPSKNVTLDLKNVPVREAIASVVEMAGGSASFGMAEMEDGPPVTVKFNSVNAEKALTMISQAAGLTCEGSPDDPKTMIVSQSQWPPSVTLEGRKVPIVGATLAAVEQARAAAEAERAAARTNMLLEAIGDAGAPEAVAGHGTRLGFGGGGIGAPPAPKRPSFRGENRLVDLVVSDTPLSEVAAKLSWKADSMPAAAGDEAAGSARSLRAGLESGSVDQIMARHLNVNIVATDAVKDIKVTARVHRWPLGEVLDMLLEQTGLVCTKEESGRVEMERESLGGSLLGVRITSPYTVTLYLVPRPELHASGPGIASSMSGSSRIAWERRTAVGPGTGGGGTGGGGGGGMGTQE